MSRPYLQHGRRHGPSGSDPIPGLAGSGIAIAAALVWNIHGTPLTVPAGETIETPWAHLTTNDPDVGTSDPIFGTDTSFTATAPYNNAAGDTYLYFPKPGLYIAFANVYNWAAGSYVRSGQIGNPGSQWVLGGSAGATITATEKLADSGLATSSYQLFAVDSDDAPGIISFELTNHDTVDHTVTTGNMGIMYFGPIDDLADIY